MDQFSALVYPPTEDGGDYVVNMDNNYLLAELKATRDLVKIELSKARYSYSMALIGMSVISCFRNRKSSNEEVDVTAEVRRITTMIAPILFPMLESMADLEIDGVSMAA